MKFEKYLEILMLNKKVNILQISTTKHVFRLEDGSSKVILILFVSLCLLSIEYNFFSLI